MSSPLEPCPCGKPWPNVDLVDPKVLQYIEWQVASLGEYVPITVGSRTWRVSRRCLAFHGITGRQLTSGASGFEEIT